jgi:hypothetical protein
MTNIDFLPASYHERSVRRRARYWRLVVVSAFSAILAIAAVGQFQIRRQLLTHMEAVDRQYADVMAESNRLLAVQAQVREARAEADLYTYLRHPWPRTQIMAQLMAALPESIAISKLAVRQEEANSLFVPAAAPTAGQPDAKAAAEAALPAAQRDLKRLREGFDASGNSVVMEGTCQELPTLHIYLGALAGSEFFSEAELRSIDRVPEGQPGTYRFQARLELRPGYGQPNGPAPAATPALPAQSTSLAEARRP